MKFLIITLFLTIQPVFGADIGIIEHNDSLTKIIDRFYPNVEYKYSNKKEFERDLKKWNPKIKNWIHPDENEFIYIDYPYPPFVGETSVPDPGRLKKVDPGLIQLFIQSSYETYNHSTDNVDIAGSNNELFVIGLTTKVSTKNNNHSLLINGKTSLATHSNINDQKTAIKREYTIELDYQLSWPLFYQSIFIGYRQESMNLINTATLIDETSLLSLKNHKINSIAAGYNFAISRLTYQINGTKIINSDLDGFSYGAKLGLRPNNSKISYNLFYQKYQLNENISEIQIQKIGVQFSYDLF